jgi:hypothetical protein
MDEVTDFKPGDKVRIREDATTDGEPFGELFMRLTWTVLACSSPDIELESQYLQTTLKLHTLDYKLRLVERPGAN